MPEAIVYTETLIHSAPEQYAADAPYQIALIEHPDGRRELVRIAGPRVRIGDTVLSLPGDHPYPLFTAKHP
jgi:uncharacterized OB-fold protein